MNERIAELAKQAGFVTWSDEEWKPKGAVIDWASDYDKELEKFAELIVRECADFIEQDQGTGEVLSNRLKKHFGVEE